MDRAAGCRPIPGNQLTLLFDGPAIYPAMLERIAKATRWIHLDTYIFRSDETGRRFADALAERARAGVRVRILTDWVGSITTRRSLWRALRQAGASVRSFNPPQLLHLRDNITRDHRKLLVVDGETAITGGHCIGNEWAGDPKAGRQPWRDTAIAIDGPAAAALDRAFAVPWDVAGEPLEDDELPAEAPSRGSSQIRVVAGEPGGLRASRATELLLAGAAERVWITDAYLVAPRDIYQALIDGARSGVDVRVLVPGKSDLPRVQNFTRIGYRDLLEAGVRIFEWRGPMLHAKTIVVDARWVRIGSSNLNVSSLLANYEIDVARRRCSSGPGHGGPVPPGSRSERGGQVPRRRVRPPPPCTGGVSPGARFRTGPSSTLASGAPEPGYGGGGGARVGRPARACSFSTVSSLPSSAYSSFSCPAPWQQSSAS